MLPLAFLQDKNKWYFEENSMDVFYLSSLLCRIEAIKKKHSGLKAEKGQDHTEVTTVVFKRFLWLWFQIDCFCGFDITPDCYASTRERGKTERLWHGMWILESMQHGFKLQNARGGNSVTLVRSREIWHKLTMVDQHSDQAEQASN